MVPRCHSAQMRSPIPALMKPIKSGNHQYLASASKMALYHALRVGRAANAGLRCGDWGFFSRRGSSMSCTLYSIVPVDGKWIVQCGTDNRGPFMSKGIALRLAFAEASAVHAKGQRSRVSIQDGAGTISAEHCLCADFQAVRSFVDVEVHQPQARRPCGGDHHSPRRRA